MDKITCFVFEKFNFSARYDFSKFVILNCGYDITPHSLQLYRPLNNIL